MSAESAASLEGMTKPGPGVTRSGVPLPVAMTQVAPRSLGFHKFAHF